MREQPDASTTPDGGATCLAWTTVSPWIWNCGSRFRHSRRSLSLHRRAGERIGPYGDLRFAAGWVGDSGISAEVNLSGTAVGWQDAR